eukprot:CAMPEP_0198353206 /NCGR_PEP_ID=MMETSP1450-20131203/110578_1 /TAXON_ID=753684 ORGANISM="Madagascaria erythrocladiodes, Strain CCMP3234" /NCGR_SAMPLE_ID=MMETSP1450 /ASSEMBLY_ACC=CAM_ASM_001115 /LENGTH=42 /DNA_ID= /DNA_START= /DNA_END= /DNA_ORIENTATION=
MLLKRDHTAVGQRLFAQTPQKQAVEQEERRQFERIMTQTGFT